ncbi:DUF4142 domain-containing protein [Pedobacter psychroterrae]|uniref:DUF4142 domain-containing protein n=2 Tax=Pedobacter psychroterrae TaxID=2530453 RepID=A0A4R0NKY9_9SPHI|nr:DUF4142 domain-containing protein [Pedobacter psychroterrae]
MRNNAIVKTKLLVYCSLSITQRKLFVMKYAVTFFSIILLMLSMGTIGQEKKPISNETFLQQSEIDGINGVALGIFAQKKVVDKHLRKYSILAHNDQVKVNNKLLLLAGKKNVSLPNILADPSLLKEIPVDMDMQFSSDETPDRVKNIFDVSYVKMMIEDYQNSVKFYESSLNTTDPDIKNHIHECLPVFRKNLQYAIRFTQQVVLARE